MCSSDLNHKVKFLPEDEVQKFMDLFITEACKAKFDLKQNAPTATTQDIPTISDEDFFGYTPGPPDGSEINYQNKVRLECLEYFQNPNRKIEMLQEYPTVKKMFIRYNTPLPSSGAVERVFNFSGMILTPKRRSISDDLFEKLTLLKCNNYGIE